MVMIIMIVIMIIMAINHFDTIICACLSPTYLFCLYWQLVVFFIDSFFFYFSSCILSCFSFFFFRFFYFFSSILFFLFSLVSISILLELHNFAGILTPGIILPRLPSPRLVSFQCVMIMVSASASSTQTNWSVSNLYVLVSYVHAQLFSLHVLVFNLHVQLFDKTDKSDETAKLRTMPISRHDQSLIFLISISHLPYPHLYLSSSFILSLIFFISISHLPYLYPSEYSYGCVWEEGCVLEQI